MTDEVHHVILGEFQQTFKGQLPTSEYYTCNPRVDGLEAIVVSDRDGVILIEARSGNAPSAALKPPYLGVFSIASEQASKLEVGKNKSIISYYSGHQVVQFNYFPLVVTFIATADANTGLLYALEEDMRETVSDLKSAVAAS